MLKASSGEHGRDVFIVHSKEEVAEKAAGGFNSGKWLLQALRGRIECATSLLVVRATSTRRPTSGPSYRVRGPPPPPRSRRNTSRRWASSSRSSPGFAISTQGAPQRRAVHLRVTRASAPTRVTSRAAAPTSSSRRWTVSTCRSRCRRSPRSPEAAAAAEAPFGRTGRAWGAASCDMTGGARRRARWMATRAGARRCARDGPTAEQWHVSGVVWRWCKAGEEADPGRG